MSSSASSAASSSSSSPPPSPSSSVVVVVHQHPIGAAHNRSGGGGVDGGDGGGTVDVDHHPLAPLVPAVIGVVLVTIIFMSIAGNLLVCVAISTDRNLRKLSNLFLVSLAVADLFVATLVMTFALTNDLIGHWIFGDGFCNVWIAFDVMGSTSSILNLCAISLDRYLHIRDPLRYSRWMTKSVVLAFIAAIWLTSCLVSFLPISQGLHLPPDGDESYNRTVTGPPSCAMDLSPTYAVVSSSISFFLPCCVMVAFYTRLYMYARMHVRNIRAMTRPLQLSHDDDPNDRHDSSRHGSAQVGFGSVNAQQQQQQQQQPAQVSEHKAAVTLGIIMGTFLICWVPFFIINITAAFCKTCISELCFKILTWLGYANSALNPIIYSIFNQEFRRAFARTLKLYGHKCFCLCHCLWRSERDEFCSNGRPKLTDAYPDQRHHRHRLLHNRDRHQIVKLRGRGGSKDEGDEITATAAAAAAVDDHDSEKGDLVRNKTTRAHGTQANGRIGTSDLKDSSV